jgi:hypothetical protein
MCGLHKPKPSMSNEPLPLAKHWPTNQWRFGVKTLTFMNAYLGYNHTSWIPSTRLTPPSWPTLVAIII